MVLDLLDQLEISHLYRIDLLGLLTGLGLLELWHLIYPRLLIRFSMLVFFTKSYGISGQIIGLISSFLSSRQLWVVLDGKSSQENSVNARVPQSSILGPTLFLLYINDLLSVISLSMLMILLCILSVIRRLIYGSNLNWLLNLNLIYETLDWSKKWLVDFNAGKTQLVLFDGSENPM